MKLSLSNISKYNSYPTISDEKKVKKDKHIFISISNFIMTMTAIMKLLVKIVQDSFKDISENDVNEGIFWA